MTNEPESRIIVHIDPDLEDLIPNYLAKRRKDCEKILAALDKNDLETIRILGHDMKGSGGGYGFDAITEIGALLEKSAKEADAEGITREISRLSVYLQQVEVVYV